MAATAELRMTALFEDDTTAQINIGPLDPESDSVQSAKARIMQFLAQGFDDEAKQLMLSKYGNKWVGFSKASMVVTEKTTLF